MLEEGDGRRRLQELNAFSRGLRVLVVEGSGVLGVEGLVQGDVVVSCKASQLADVLQAAARTGTSYHELGLEICLLQPCDRPAEL